MPGPRTSLAYLESCIARLPYPLAIEFRDPSWFIEGRAERTFEFLRAHGLARTLHPSLTRSRVPVEERNTAYAITSAADGPTLDAWVHTLARPPNQGEMDALQQESKTLQNGGTQP